MNTHIKSALEKIAQLKRSVADALQSYGADDEFLDWRDLVDSIERADEDIEALEDDLATYKVKNRELESILSSMEEEAEQYVTFPVESLEDQFKIEIFQELYVKKSLKQLEELIKQ